ncbi:CPBP family intramembrane glutamic endopeptidase [Catalinimonas niigatensis]|uniref:CPBP family intramembrane glutamic endopeptidase n=1 Tax=Catalinimonas niigatensis TaxID=1397264 RepID=UPI0026656349|nr:type II CAAX endopeptidase family protein [Catalinimonas niigatensis]WPP49837.1 type II CAAX endopeptidase family protein [Catalinimonas niigatensis]
MDNISFALSSNDIPSVLSISMVITGFITFWFIAESPKLKASFETKYPTEKATIVWVQFQKYTGVFFLGIIPLLISLLFLPYDLKDLGLSFQNTGMSMLWIIGLSCIIFPLNINAAKRPQNLSMYPMIRAKVWDSRLIIINALATISYLFAYELLFRGILLTACVDSLGVWPAIVINVALYSAVHLPKGPAETIGAIPFGLLICYITLTTGTIWVAVMIHIILSLSNDYLALYYNPEMQVKLRA